MADSPMILVELGLDLESVLRILGLNQPIAEIECRSHITLHLTAELLDLVGSRQLRRALLEQFKILHHGLSNAAVGFGKHRANAVSGRIDIGHDTAPRERSD